MCFRGDKAQVVVELAEECGVVEHAVPFDGGGAGGRQDDVGVVAKEERVAADGELQVVDELAEVGGVIEHAVPFNGCRAGGRQDDVSVVAKEEGIATYTQL